MIVAWMHIQILYGNICKQRTAMNVIFLIMLAKIGVYVQFM